MKLHKKSIFHRQLLFQINGHVNHHNCLTCRAEQLHEVLEYKILQAFHILKKGLVTYLDIFMWYVLYYLNYVCSKMNINLMQPFCITNSKPL